MENFFEVAPLEHVDNTLPEKRKESIPTETLELDLKKDYEIARDNFHELIDKGKEAMEDILSIARESEKGRDFEVAATMLKNVIEANEKMIDLHRRVREISNYKAKKEESSTNIKNALFVGSTTELSKLIKDLNTKDITPE